MAINYMLMKAIESFISALAPHKCLVCKIDGSIICEPCRLTVLAVPPERCYRCHKASLGSQTCVDCRPATKLEHVWVATDYQEVAAEVIRVFKYERVQAAAGPIAACLADLLPDLPKETLVVHIPTANNRVRRRGYDQAALIAKKLARLRNWRHETLLMRRGKTRQVGAGRSERFRQIESSLIPIKADKIKKMEILLIDDVTTTGASIEAAAKVLKTAGAKYINAAVFAQPTN